MFPSFESIGPIETFAIRLLVLVTLFSFIGWIGSYFFALTKRDAWLTSVVLLIFALPIVLFASEVSGLRLRVPVLAMAGNESDEAGLAPPRSETEPTAPPWEGPAADELSQDVIVSTEHDLTQTRSTEANGTQQLDEPVSAETIDYRVSIWYGLFGVWVLGVSIGLIRMGLGFSQLRRIARDAVQLNLQSPDLDTIQRALPGSTRFQIVESERISVPIIFGFLKPVVALPAGLSKRLNDEELTAVLIHELAHGVRSDCLVGLLQKSVRVLFWFHPFVILLSRSLTVARENVCDNVAIRIVAPTVYARLLVRLSQNNSLDLMPTAMPLISESWNLETRIKGLLDERRDMSIHCSSRFRLGLISLGCVALLFSSTQLAAMKRQQSSQDEETDSARDLYGDELPSGSEVRLGTKRLRLEGSHSGVSLAFTKESELLVLDQYGNLDWWDPIAFRIKRSRQLNFDCHSFEVSPDRSEFAVVFSRTKAGGERENGVEFRSLETGDLQGQIPLGADPRPSKVKYLPNGKSFVLLGRFGKAQLIDRETLEASKSIELPVGRRHLDMIAVSNDGDQIALASKEKIFVWQWRRGLEPIAVREEEGASYQALAFANQNKSLFIATNRRGVSSIDQLDLERKEISQQLLPPLSKSMRIEDLVVDDEQKLVIASDRVFDVKSSGILFWNLETGEFIRRLHSDADYVGPLAVSQDQKLLASMGRGTLQIWDWESGKQLGDQFVGHKTLITGVRFIPGTEKILTSSDDTTARIWNARTGECQDRVVCERWIRAMSVSPDGKKFATSSFDDRIRVFDTESLAVLHEFKGHGSVGIFRSLAFSSDSKRLAGFGDEPILRVWEVETGEQILGREIRPNGNSLTTGDGFGPPLDRVAGISEDASLMFVTHERSAFVFDVNTGEQKLEIASERPFKHGCFAPNNKSILLFRPYVDDTFTRLPGGGGRFQIADKFEAVLFDLKTKEKLWTYQLDGRAGPSRVHPDGKLVFVGELRKDQKDVMHVLDFKTGEQLSEFEVEELGWMNSGGNIDFTSDGRIAISMNDSHSVVIWDLKKNGVLK